MQPTSPNPDHSDDELTPDDGTDPERDPWAPVTDLDEGDLDDPSDEDPVSDRPLPWSTVEDTADDDIDFDPQSIEDEEKRPNPWSPVDENAPVEEVLSPSSEKRTFSSEPAALPIYRGSVDPNRPPDRLPWRTTASILEPPLFDLSCVADPTSDGSQLLVAAWEWVEPPGDGTRLRFRLVDDGPSIEAEVPVALEAAIDATVRLEGRELDGRFRITLSRAERGLRLGRDLLVGQFVVDPSRDAWDNDGEVAD